MFTATQFIHMLMLMNNNKNKHRFCCGTITNCSDVKKKLIYNRIHHAKPILYRKNHLLCKYNQHWLFPFDLWKTVKFGWHNRLIDLVQYFNEYSSVFVPFHLIEFDKSLPFYNRKTLHATFMSEKLSHLIFRFTLLYF